ESEQSGRKAQGDYAHREGGEGEGATGPASPCGPSVNARTSVTLSARLASRSSAIWSVVDRAFWRSEEWRPALSNSGRRLHHEDFTRAAGDAVEEAGRAFVPVDSLTLGLHAQGLDVVQH